MTEITGYTLGDDLPKQNPWREDKLGYAPFAERVAKVIINLTASNGYVIGLHGKWGSGKSTAINFVLEHIKKHNAENEDRQVIHIDFRPWIVSGHQDLIVAFFKILSERLGPKDSGLKRRWRQTLQYISGTTDNLVDAAATVAITVDPSGGVATGFVGNLTKKSVNSLLGRFLEDPSLQLAYEDLNLQLARSGKRFLVTIDDIDRLNDKDVKAIMQLVKSIGQLPNVVYLLAYDREIVWNALDQGKNRAGPRFAEKIVQQEIELPKPTRNALLTILDRNISFLVGSSEDNTRWYGIVRDGIHRWIRSPRDIVRLSNAVKFSWSALQNEIDPQDLLAVEGLRLFDEGAFNWVRDNRDFLFSQGRFMLPQDEVRTAAVGGLKARIPEEIQPQVLRIISLLFPQSSKLLEGRQSFDGEVFIEVQKRRGIGSEAGYDAYFGMHPSSDMISKVIVNDFMSRLENVDEIETIICSYMKAKNSRGELMVAKLLEELLVQYRARVPARPTQALLDALFRVGGEIIAIEKNDELFVLSPGAQIGFLIRCMLELWGIALAGKRLIEAFEKGSSPAFLADVYVDRGRELGVFKSDTSVSPLISEDDFNRLGKILLDKIQAAAKDETLKDAPFYFDIARSWAKLDKPETVRLWLATGMTESAKFLAKVGRGLVSYALGTAERRYTMRDRPEDDLYDLRTVVDAGMKHLQGSDLSKDERNLITELVRGSKKILSVQSSEETNDENQSVAYSSDS